jgi:drug/metabolite transporter (DMT)-like permease
VIAALLGAVVLGEEFPLSSVAGMVLILSGSWLATGVDARHRKIRSGERGVGASHIQRSAQ